ncbi:MAG: nucleotidyl transferase AbiEii/AbiGii toxin family protein [Prevotellaceae bacterium]|jgi:hypothetical protein|nr:nucleotidyl transferase AbiEii/AbiGii toxin family protein [Prevotellaceae bacterium]
MHNEILTSEQQELFPYISQFKRTFYLVGGTAIALHIGHRESIDYDLFIFNKLNRSRVKRQLLTIPFRQKIIFEDVDQLHFYINDVKVTFFSYPYKVEHPVAVGNIITMPTLLSLAAMKAFALGRRAKWKDYVDLYFLVKNYFSIAEISCEATRLFSEQFSEKLFRQQLAFHKDINYSEEVKYFPGFEVNPEDIKQFLIDVSIKI